jgi:hypothetical protein
VDKLNRRLRIILPASSRCLNENIALADSRVHDLETIRIYKDAAVGCAECGVSGLEGEWHMDADRQFSGLSLRGHRGQKDERGTRFG